MGTTSNDLGRAVRCSWRGAAVLLTVVSALACAERPTATPPADVDAAAAPPRTAKRASPAPSPELRVTVDAITLAGEAVATPRSADAPGVLDDQLRPTYGYPELINALADASADARARPDRVLVDPAVSVGVLRGVLASIAAPGASIELVLQGEEPVELLVTRGHEGAPQDGVGLVHVRATGLQLERGGALSPLYDDVAALRQAERADAKALELAIPDDREVAELARLGAALRDDAKSPITLAYSFAPCLEPPPGMVCVPGGPTVVGYDDGLPEERPRREIVVSTFYIKGDKPG